MFDMNPCNSPSNSSQTNEKVYSIRAAFNKDIFTMLMVDDEINPNEFERKFTQDDFPTMRLFDVAKMIVDAINNTQQSECKSPYIYCYEWKDMAFVTVLGTSIPTLILSPKKTKSDSTPHATNMMKMESNTPRSHSNSTRKVFFPAYVVFQRMIGSEMTPQYYGMWCYVGI
eukprot:443273_1